MVLQVTPLNVHLSTVVGTWQGILVTHFPVFHTHVFIHTMIVTELANVWSPRAILVVFIKLTVMHSCTTQIGTLHYHELTIPSFRIKVFYYISQGTDPWATVLILGASNTELVHFANKVLVQHGGKRR